MTDQQKKLQVLTRELTLRKAAAVIRDENISLFDYYDHAADAYDRPELDRRLLELDEQQQNKRRTKALRGRMLRIAAIFFVTLAVSSVMAFSVSASFRDLVTRVWNLLFSESDTHISLYLEEADMMMVETDFLSLELMQSAGFTHVPALLPSGYALVTDSGEYGRIGDILLACFRDEQGRELYFCESAGLDKGLNNETEGEEVQVNGTRGFLNTDGQRTLLIWPLEDKFFELDGQIDATTLVHIAENLAEL